MNSFLVASSILLLGLLTLSCSQEPTRWNGPSADGFYPDKELLKEWPEEGPKILWTYDSLGVGFSSAAIQNGSLYITGMVDSTGYLYKMNLQGDLIYSIPYGPEWNGQYPGSRCTPTVVGNKLYVVSGKGKLICLSTKNGRILWSKDYFADFGGLNITYGISESPVVDGELIYATPGGPQNNVIALNRHSGELVWSCKGEGGLSSNCTPLLFEHNGRKLLTTYTAAHLLGIDATDGMLLWSVPAHNSVEVNMWTPIYSEGEIYYPTGNEVGGGKLKLSKDGDSISELWVDQISDYAMFSILVDGFLYEAHAYTKRLSWRIVNWETGEEVYGRKGGLPPGRGIWADSMLYVYTMRGVLGLVKPEPDVEIINTVSRVQVTAGSGPHQAQPVIHNGILYIRHGNALIAYNVSS